MEKVLSVMSIFIAFTSISMLYQMDLFSLLWYFRKGYVEKHHSVFKTPMKDLWRGFIRYFIPFFWGRVSMMTVLSEIWRMFFFFLIWTWGIKEFDAFISQPKGFVYFFISFFIIGLIIPAFLIQKQNER